MRTKGSGLIAPDCRTPACLFALLSALIFAGAVWPIAAYADNDSCRWAQDGECDELRYGGTGACADGTDMTDCGVAVGGNDSCRWANDGECDELQYNGTGACANGTDTTDCSVAASGNNTCQWAFDRECDEPGVGTGACAPGTDAADCRSVLAGGDDSCHWAQDGECDEPRYGGTGACTDGTDTADCRTVASGNNTCRWAFDRECDHPDIGTGACAAGTDTADCRALEAGGEDSCRWALDGECDEPGIGTGVCTDGTDVTDCRPVANRRNRDNSCETAFDDQCDEPGTGTGQCRARTDTVDCLGRATPVGIRDHYFGHDDRFVPETKHLPWRAIGLLVEAGGGTCTAALVAPTVALTAAHCVINADGSSGMPDAFLAGFNGNSHAARAEIVSFLANPGYNPEISQEGEDWAFLELSWPIGEETGYFEVHEINDQDIALLDAGQWDLLSQGGYSWDSPDRMTANAGCPIVEIREAFGFLHQCDTTHGDSGSPLFIERDGRYLIVGVDSEFLDTEKGGLANLAVDSRAFSGPLQTFLTKIEQR